MGLDGQVGQAGIGRVNQVQVSNYTPVPQNTIIAQNTRNRAKYSTAASSKYKGVCRNKAINRWQAKICWNRKQIYLGCFTDEVEAAKAYDQAARQYHGAFASLNFAPASTEPDLLSRCKSCATLILAYLSSRFVSLNFPEIERSSPSRARRAIHLLTRRRLRKSNRGYLRHRFALTDTVSEEGFR